MTPESLNTGIEIPPFKGIKLTHTEQFIANATYDDELLSKILGEFFDGKLHEEFIEEIPKFPVKLFFEAAGSINLNEKHTQRDLKTFSENITEISTKRGKPLVLQTLNGVLFEGLACAQMRQIVKNQNVNAVVTTPKETKNIIIKSYSEVAKKQPSFHNLQTGYAQEILHYKYPFEGDLRPLYVPDGFLIFGNVEKITLLEYKKDIDILKHNQFTNLKTLKRILKDPAGENLRNSLAKNIGISPDYFKKVGSLFVIDVTNENPQKEEYIKKNTDSDACLGVLVYGDELAYLRSCLILDYMKSISKK